MKKVKLYCIKINDLELKTVDEKEYISFLRANKKDVHSFTQVMIIEALEKEKGNR